MATNRAEQFQIPPEMRALAEKSVEQAKQAVEGFISAAQRTVSALEGQAETARKGAKDVGGKAMEFAEQNIDDLVRLRAEAGARQGRPGDARAAGCLHQDPDAGAGGAGQGARPEHRQDGHRSAEIPALD